ncbi:kunitz-type serine protease inhibitor A-like isoform X2 [Dermacentor silvarum]|uniref:kunitz-type serine protease inhibitor A-like isoform X2 n=1 Tax=Dermacentor silvarum TaxID=543639 RepID=UPI00210095E7|nr:kunitz-type serine protease inhibitor A-like isoform X2 [Dermacentor silvarum]
MKVQASLPVLLFVAQVHASPPKTCMKQPYIGSCHPLHGFWYYNPNTYSCIAVPPGTCASGRNLFPTLSVCEKTCIPLTLKKAKVCLKLPIEGPCGPVYVSWYYDYGSHQCKMFNRTICGGGANDFVTEERCQAICLRKHRPLCSLQPKPGKCLVVKLRWYFDDSSNRCREFANDRCGTNDNAFVSMRKCMERCSYALCTIVYTGIVNKQQKH